MSAESKTAQKIIPSGNAAVGSSVVSAQLGRIPRPSSAIPMVYFMCWRSQPPLHWPRVPLMDRSPAPGDSRVQGSPVLSVTFQPPRGAETETMTRGSTPSTEARSCIQVLAGRRVRSMDVTAQGPGRHVISMGNASTLPAGMHLIRLHNAQRTLVVKAVVMR